MRRNWNFLAVVFFCICCFSCGFNSKKGDTYYNGDGGDGGAGGDGGEEIRDPNQTIFLSGKEDFCFQMVVRLSETNLKGLEGDFYMKGDPLTKFDQKDILLVRDGDELISPYLNMSGKYRLDVYCLRAEDGKPVYLDYDGPLLNEGGICGDF